MINLLVPVALAGLIAGACSGAQAAQPSTQIRKDGIVFKCSLASSIYVEGEPIIVRCAVTNDSKEARVLVDPTESYDNVVLLTSQTAGTRPMPHRIQSDWPPMPDDWGWKFKPGEERCLERDLFGEFNEVLPVGSYTVSAIYEVPKEVTAAWHGTVATAPLSFSVIPPSGIEIAASKSFEKAVADAQVKVTAKEAVKILDKLMSEKEAGRFAKYAGYWRAVACFMAGEEQCGVDGLRDYIKTRGQVPVYGRFAIMYLGAHLVNIKQYAAAREVFMKLPEGADRRYCLQDCSNQEKAGKP